MTIRRRAAIACAILAVAPLAAAASPAPAGALAAFPDYLSVRSEFLSAAITAAPARALAFKPAYRDTPAGRIRVSVERDGASFYVLFQRERDGGYPVGSAGNMVIQRAVSTGYVTGVVWYLSDDGTSYVSMTPRNERTVVDYVVAGALSRGDYPLSRLVYQVFTGSFRAFHDATRGALDWTLAFGQPGPEASEAFVSDLSSDTPSRAARALLSAADDFSTVGAYLSAVDAAGYEPEELREPRFAKAASLEDPRAPALKPLRPWSDDRGLPIEAAMATMLAAPAGGAYIALVDGVRELPPRKLVIVPYRDGLGAYALPAFDAETAEAVDLAGVVRSMAGASIRLFSLPLP
ncbi:MAG TPA: hypothetical protein P5298_05675 [Spirochaetia bacterium]|nr:hypothetical protein [Spirochaetales bacterium]HRW23876.1 hypothetical protein [Spirochaetia bacterium]